MRIGFDVGGEDFLVEMSMFSYTLSCVKDFIIERSGFSYGDIDKGMMANAHRFRCRR